MLMYDLPLFEVSLVRELHDRWYAAYDHHAQRLIDRHCDKPCKILQRTYMAAAIRRTLAFGVIYMQALAIQSECTRHLVEGLTEEYLKALGLPDETVESAVIDLARASYVHPVAMDMQGSGLQSLN